MSHHKYTKDGRKVAVLSSEGGTFIVREVLIQDGTEVASGPVTTVPAVYDAPVKTWKEERVEEVERRYEKAERELKVAIEKEREARKALRAGKAFRAYVSKLAQRLDDIAGGNGTEESEEGRHALDLLVDFSAGKVEYLVFNNGWKIEVRPFREAIADDKERPDSFRLLSLFGQSDGSIAWRLGQYSDTSGGSYRVIPCRSMEEAKAVVSEEVADMVERRGCNPDLVNLRDELGLDIPTADDVKTMNAKREKVAEEAVKAAKLTLEGKEKDLERLRAEMKS